MNHSKMINPIYYFLKPIIPRQFQIWLRSKAILRKRKKYLDVWPILEKSSSRPNKRFRWPEQKQFALVLTHDVETTHGQSKCPQLMALEKSLNFRASFNFVPERYEVSSELRRQLVRNGFEVGVHGLNHDGKLFQSKKIFQSRAFRINKYIEEWNVVGFRAPAMHHNLEWMHELNIEYDMSTFETDPFEPQSDGVSTIFPFWVPENKDGKGYVELPYTLPQDFTLFVLLKERNIDIWKTKLDWIAENGGMALVNTHPDYMNFSRDKPGIDEYPAKYYQELLEYAILRYEGQFWPALPKQVANFFKYFNKEQQKSPPSKNISKGDLIEN